MISSYLLSLLKLPRLTLTTLTLLIAYTAQFSTLSAQATTLPIPPLDSGVVNDSDKVREFDLNFQEGQKELIPGKITKTFGVNGDILGPTLRFSSGEKVRIKVNNQLKEDTTAHWHGMRIPAVMDGGVHNIVQPGESWTAEFDVINPASTLWYHPHVMGNTGAQVYKGLAGLIIIDDAQEAALDLPREYGVDDIPVIIQDRKFTKDGQFQYVQSMMDLHMGMMGNRLLINGALEPTASVPAKMVRLRLLNGSNARFYQLRFQDKRKFFQIATDGGLMDKSVELSELSLSPGERAEIIVDLSTDFGKTLAIEGFQAAAGGKESVFTILPISVDKAFSGINKGVLPQTLVKNNWLLEKDAQNQRSFKLQMNMGGMMGGGAGGGMSHNSMFTINDVAMDINKINETVKINTTEIWTIESNEMVHNFHVHNVQFQVLDRGGRAPAAYENGWKDTVQVAPGAAVRILLRFTDYTDSKSPYMYHCHVLEHEDQGLMGQFVVVE
ncbi:MAG: multicopper oxidase domain-containing protein [Oligoflexales bacterium]|nr:multicopper oxidase domain-containing protein [Oligoflexales bacterium]